MMHRLIPSGAQRSATLGILSCIAAGSALLTGCAADAFNDIDGPEPVLPDEVLALEVELRDLRSLGVHGDVAYVAARSGRDDRCLVMYRPEDPAKPVVGCSSGPWVRVGGEVVGEATFFSQGNAHPDDYAHGEEVSKWLVIHS